jgi:hypothetical protein
MRAPAVSETPAGRPSLARGLADRLRRPHAPAAASPAARRNGIRRAVGHGLILAGLLFLGYLFIIVAPREGIFGLDALAYWSVQQPDVYGVPHTGLGSFPYSPPAALVANTFDGVSLYTFLWLWSAVLIASVIFVGGRGAWILAAFAFPPVALDLLYGNIHVLLAVAIVLGFRHPWTWTFVLLTKFTCGIGLLWFAVRREWRNLALATVPAAVICLVTLLLFPGLWADWFAYLAGSSQDVTVRGSIPIPLWPRLIAAIALVVWGARTDRRWTVIVAATLALPVLWIAGLAMLVGLIPELRGGSGKRGKAPQPAELADA